MNPRSLIAILILAGLAAGAWWLADRHEPPAGGENAADGGPVPDYYFKHAEITHYGPDGKPDTVLDADSVQHFPDSKITRFQHITVHGGSQDHAWSVSARHANAGDDRKVMHLEGNVRLTSGNGPQPLIVTTERLTLYADKNFAQTDAPVVARQGSSRVDGKGLSVWLDAKRFELQSEVKGRYERP